MDRSLFYLSLARKAGLAELGEEPVGAAAKAGKAALVIVARDASEHTWRRGLSFVAGTAQPCIRVPYTKDEMGAAIGREALAMAALTDAGMALSLVRSLEQPDALVLKALQEAAQHRKTAGTKVRRKKPGIRPAKQK